MSTRSLDEWLDFQSRLNPNEIELGLERVKHVWKQLGEPVLATKVVTVAGTNGKGSSITLIEAMLDEASYRVGCFTSPHLINYNERIRVCGKDASDAEICSAFEQIEDARGEVALTYFEYGTLAALLIFSKSDLDIALLEVGLGGRLDAVNLIDADVALVTGIALDHMDWLGDDIEQIGREKAGIFRKNRPAISAALDAPKSIEQVAQDIGAKFLSVGADYTFEELPESWHWRSSDAQRLALPKPVMRGRVQIQNAAAALQVLECLQDDFPVDQKAVRAGLLAAKVAGRFDLYQREARWVLDVAHNPQAIALLSSQLGDFFVHGKVHLVLGMLRDKAIQESIAELASKIDVWHLVDLSQEQRGASDVELEQALHQVKPDQSAMHYSDIYDCFTKVDALAGKDDLVLVIGSFLTVSSAMNWLQDASSRF